MPASCSEPLQPPPVPSVAPLPSISPGCLPGTVLPSRIRLGIARHGTQQVDRNTPLADYLASRTGLPVEIVPTDRYDELAEGLLNGLLEAAVLPPLEYVRAHDRDPCLRAHMTGVFDGLLRYSSYLVIRKDSGLTSVRQLAGQPVAFVDRTSASGWLFPAARLAEFAVEPFRDLKEVLFLGNHRAVIQAVLDGRAKAGATYPGAMDAARREGLDVGALTILGITGRIPYDTLVVRPDLDPDQTRALVEAFAGLNTTTAEGRAVRAFGENASGWVPTTDAFYDEVRDVARLLRRLGEGTP